MHRVRVRIVEDALDANATIAAANRADFDRAGSATMWAISATLRLTCHFGRASLILNAFSRSCHV